MTEGELSKRVGAICASVGFDLADVDPAIVDRLRLLSAHSATVADAERMVGWALAIFRHYAVNKPDEAFTETERRTVVLGCLFSDVGKTGPVHADAAGRKLVVEMFSIERVHDEAQPVSRFLQTYFPADADARTACFRDLGLDPAMPMRAFWDLHTGWTLDVAEAAGVPLEAVAAAATHHMLEGINPRHIVGPDQRFTRAFGLNVAFDRSEKLVIVLDKYDAVRRRGRMGHRRAIAWLRDTVRSNPRFRDDAVLATLISDLDVVIG